jgi:hypothetical protein
MVCSTGKTGVTNISAHSALHLAARIASASSQVGGGCWRVGCDGDGEVLLRFSAMLRSSSCSDGGKNFSNSLSRESAFEVVRKTCSTVESASDVERPRSLTDATHNASALRKDAYASSDTSALMEAQNSTADCVRGVSTRALDSTNLLTAGEGTLLILPSGSGVGVRFVTVVCCCRNANECA